MMSRNTRSSGAVRIAAWAVLCVFVAGFFYGPIGVWTGAILGTWFAGTQRIWRGFVWMLGFGVLFGLPHWWTQLAHGSGEAMGVRITWIAAGLVLGVLPFTLHRAISAQLRGFLWTLPLPLCAAAIAEMERMWLPQGVEGFTGRDLPATLRGVGAVWGTSAVVFVLYWFAATMVWMWNEEYRWKKIGSGVVVFVVASALVIGFGLLPEVRGLALPATLPVSAGGAAVLGAWAWMRARKEHEWRCSAETLPLLQSPVSGEPLQIENAGGAEVLRSAANEQFPVRDGIADLRRPEDLTGSNEKYNRLYETIGGFYDDIQRVTCALSGIDRDAYVRSYLDLLEVKAGDAVLETSVGTGLNFKYLPRGVRLCGIDLSPEMLVNSRRNLRRWNMEADLFLGNAESLPFAEASFDVVFHVGGINFFNDRGKAIREMIRVAKPGSRILIADETEEHVKQTFERGPIVGRYYKNRKEAVSAPVDLVPAEMRETHVEILNVIGKNRFYALTFRKPGCGVGAGKETQRAGAEK